MDFSPGRRSLEVEQVFVAGVGTEAHGWEGRVSTTLGLSMMVPRWMGREARKCYFSVGDIAILYKTGFY